MTRDRDANVCPRSWHQDCPIDVELQERGRIANDAHGDLFLSIHVNAAGPGETNPRGVRGLETYFLAEAKTEDERRVEAMENEVVRFETAASVPAHNPLAFIINDMAQNEHLRESSELASCDPGKRRSDPSRRKPRRQAGELQRAAKRVHAGGARRDRLWIQRKGSAVAGAVTPGSANWPRSIADATLDYLEGYERRVRTGAQR